MPRFRILGWLILSALGLHAEPFLSPIFSDNLVLQRGRPAVFWGWAKAGSHVHATLQGKSADVEVDAGGTWRISLPTPPVGGPYEVAFSGAQTVTLHNVLVGDVWICGGQSNMVFGLGGSQGGKGAAASATDSQIRLFTVGDRSAYAATTDLKGTWSVCSPETAAKFSAVGYYFGHKLREEVRVPIGLIQDCVGGSPVESWMSATALGTTGQFAPQIAEIAKLHERHVPELGSFLMHWLADYDVGGKDNAWAQPTLDTADWKSVPIPGGVNDLGLMASPGVCWFRREVDLPDPLPAGQARIELGVVDKMDTTFINGRWVGASSWVENPRKYLIPAGVLHSGKNLLAVRVFKVAGHGGFESPAAILKLVLGNHAEIPLAGAWQGKVSVDATPPHPQPLDLENYPTMPVVLYDGMIAPLAKFGLAGALWYQGEANSLHPEHYRKLLTALIGDWRVTFDQPDLQFYIVSLPAFGHRNAAPQAASDGWTRLRAAQAETAEMVPHAAIAITVDTGDANNIHPTMKRPAGERLAADALALHYHLPVPYQGPTYANFEVSGSSVVLRFLHTDGGLSVHGPHLGEFSVAGADHVWHWADAKITAPDTVTLTCKGVPAPLAARYAWQSNPEATLYNGADLPAVPFRTDDWP